MDGIDADIESILVALSQYNIESVLFGNPVGSLVRGPTFNKAPSYFSQEPDEYNVLLPFAPKSESSRLGFH